MSRQRRRAEAKKRQRSKKHHQCRFLPTLAWFDGWCDICGRPYGVGESIYLWRKTADTVAFKCHHRCYESRMGTLGPSWRPSPTESELTAVRDQCQSATFAISTETRATNGPRT